MSISNIQSHEHLFSFLGNDMMLNEFLWRADTSVNRLKYDIEQILHLYGYPLLINTNITNSGVYINVFNNSKQIFHISFHLKKSFIQPPKSPGAIHIKNNTAFRTYQLLHVFEIQSSCNPGLLNRLEFTRGTINPSSQSSICGPWGPAIDIILSIFNRYFNQPTDPLSLYHNLSNKTQVHFMLMPIIRTRPTNITRTSLTAGMIGGSLSKYKQSYKNKHQSKNGNRKTYNNRKNS